MITCLGRVFITEHRLLGVPKFPGKSRVEARPEPWISLRQHPLPTPVAAVVAMLSRRWRSSGISILPGSRSPLRGINKRSSVCSPLSPSPGEKGTSGSAADGSGYFFGCRKSGLSWQARSEVWMGENKWSVIGFSFSIWERCWFPFARLKHKQAKGRVSLPPSLPPVHFLIQMKNVRRRKRE